ncbi:MAG: hypothetical protein ABIQ18_03275 [Umezawaea sp.]
MANMTTGERKSLLGIYLNDHLAGVVAGGELAKRLAAAQRGKPAGEVLGRITREVLDDRLALLEVMADLGVPVRRYKAVGAWVGERIGRLKLNGHLFRRSPLSSVVELEALLLVVEGEEAAWRALRLIADRHEALDPDALDRLADRARARAGAVEELRVTAVREALG